MPRRGAFARDFSAAEAEPVVLAGAIGERVVRASNARKSVSSTRRIDPRNYQCSRLAGELADEWVEYMAAAELSSGSVTTYRQAINLLCESVDAALSGEAPKASLATDQPDLMRALAAWERTLPSDFPPASMRPSFLAGAIRVLIRRRIEHPDRPVTQRIEAFALADSGVPMGESTELDEFSRKEKMALVRGAWAAVIALEKRLTAGWDLVARGRHPDGGSWMSVPDLLWGLAHEAITPRDIHEHLPVARLWPAELIRCIQRPSGTVAARSAKQVLDRWLVAQLWPTSLDLHAFRILLMDATGHAPEEVSGLSENDVEFVPGGVRLALVKLRARRHYYRSFKDDRDPEIDDAVEAEEFKDRPRREPSVIVQRLMDITEKARLRAADPERKLFVSACVKPDLTLKFGEWCPEASPARFVEWLRATRSRSAVIPTSGGCASRPRSRRSSRPVAISPTPPTITTKRRSGAITRKARPCG